MKKILTTALVALFPMLIMAQGWPANYDGVMLQGFYWDSFSDTRWPNLESQADELSEFFKLVWIPQSANCGGTSMGYDDLYWFSNYNSSFGSEAQLRSMINTFKSKGIGTIADVVVNHRKTINDWVTFPTEVYKGVTYQLKSTDICKNDDGGATLSWANQNGKQLSANNDTGEDWGGMRDLDHRSENVQNNVKAYLKMLLNDLGYIGFRYDMTKGYSASFTGQYNAYSNPQYSVGEYWDGNENAVKNWIDGTKVDGVVQSAAFDFPFRYVIRDAVNNNRWTGLAASSSKGLNMASAYKRYSVTFVENHDTQYRDANNQQDPIRNNIEAANAFLLAMPGTPCIFLKHWQDYKESIKQMIYVRQLAGISNMSTSFNMANSPTVNYYVQRTVGTRGAVLAAMGSTSYAIPETYVVVASGTNYRLALSKTTETAWASKPSGEYEGAIDVTLTAVSQTAGAQLVYTLDGSDPTASNGTKVADGSTVTITGKTTFKVGLLINGQVTGVITRYYDVDNATFEPYEITVYLKDPTPAPNNWTAVNFYTWDSSDKQFNGNWPGQTITNTAMVNGVKFYYHTYNITGKNYYMNFVFNQGGTTAGSHQTVDVTYVNKTSFFEVTSQTNPYQVKNVTEEFLPYITGDSYDVNGDSEVNIADVNALIDLILTGSASGQGDVNGDGEVNIADVNAVIDRILRH
jgi:alpha-amylase